MNAGGTIDDEEDVELDEGGEHEEDRVHAEADEADLAIELEAIEGQSAVEEYEGRHERHRAVDQTLRVYLHEVLALDGGEKGGLDEPGQTKAEEHVEDVRADRVADAHCTVTWKGSLIS